VLFQAGPEPIDQYAGSSKSGQFHRGGRSEQDSRPERQRLEVEADRRDVLAEVSRTELIAASPQYAEQFGWDQVRLAQIGQAGLPSGQISVPNVRSSVSVAFDAVAFHQQDVALRHLAEPVSAICRHGHNDAFENHCPSGCTCKGAPSLA
jgi:hypothetical protein